MRRLLLGFLVLLGSGVSTRAGEKSDLRVLYVGAPSSPRGQAYAKFLATHFTHAEAANRDGFDPARATAFDVVLLDWSQDDRGAKPPLGPKDKWARPTVLLGSAGLLLAERWEVHGAVG
ncbi:MAG: hypothetical protein U0871_04515 [Gemmataceae bacterium]